LAQGDRPGTLVQYHAVDRDQAGAAAELGDDMISPYLVEQRARSCACMGIDTRLLHTDRTVTSVRPLQITAARLADDLTVVVDQLTAEIRAHHLTLKLEAFERRIALRRLGFRGAHGEGAIGIDKHDVGIETGRQVSLAGQAETTRRIPGGQLGDAVERQAAAPA